MLRSNSFLALKVGDEAVYEFLDFFRLFKEVSEFFLFYVCQIKCRIEVTLNFRSR